MARIGVHRVRFFAVAVVLLLGGALAWSWLASPANPKFRDTRLSTYLHNHHGINLCFASSVRRPTPQEIKEHLAEARASLEALSALGPDAVPLLRGWIGKTGSPMARKVGIWLFQQGYSLPALVTDRHAAACAAVRVIPEHCASLLPNLMEYSLHENTAQASTAATAAEAILRSPARHTAAKQLPPGTIHELLSAMRSDSPHVHALAVLLVQLLDVGLLQPGQTEPVLRELLAIRDLDFAERIPSLGPNGAFQIRSYLDQSITLLDLNHSLRALIEMEGTPSAEAAWRLGRSSEYPERAVPLLAASLSSADREVVKQAVIALGRYGPEARQALPAVTPLLSHEDQEISQAASDFISGLAQPATNADLKNL